jgi:(2Fe-2S) ferredoxin
MPLFERHVFVCTNTRPDGHPRGCCHAKGAEAVRDALKAETARRGLGKRVRINAAGCLDQCQHGVTVVVYPEQVWYGFVSLADVQEIVDSHLINGCPVERLRLPESCINAPRCPHNAGST